MDEFVGLHVHTEYSLLDGAGKIDLLCEEAARLGQPAVAITDHGSLGGAFRFYRSALNHGVKPIIGEEFYVAPSSREEKSAVFFGTPEQRSEDVGGAGAYTHLTVLAANEEGLRNLYRLHNLGYQEGFYRKPRIDRSALEEYSDGLIVLSGCLGGELQTRLKLGQLAEADNYLDWGKQVFPDRFFVEVMSHGLPIEDEINPLLIGMAANHGIPTVATNDSHYVQGSQREAHDALLCLQTYAKLSDSKRFRFDGWGYHLRTRGEMETLPLPTESLENTLAVADMVEGYSMFDHNLRMPYVPDSSARLRSLLREGSDRMVWSAEYRQRLDYEVAIIDSLGYAAYFVFLRDVLSVARSKGIRIGPGRGSAGGSLVAYKLGITDLDPIRHGLLFERFLNPERKSLPDIDIDVAEHQREELLEIVREYAGDGRVATIGTYGTIGAKAALHDSARVLGFPRRTSEELVARLPKAEFGRQPSLSDGDWSELSGDQDSTLQLAEQLEGLIRTQSQHAAGVIVSPVELTSEMPLWLKTGKGHDITQFTMEEVEALGFQKMDFLGLRNLTIIDKVCSYTGVDFQDLPKTAEECNDPETFRAIAKGETLGVFQFDSALMRGLLRDVAPTTFADITAVLALGRPGPMGANTHKEYAKRKRRRSYDVVRHAIHPELAFPEIFETTYGLLVYQEQVLQVLEAVCGWGYAEADTVFAAMRKKDREKMAAAKPFFLRDGRKHGFSEEALEALWDTLVPYADYSFNKAHSAGYGLISYWTAYLKTHYPNEYMAAVLSTVEDEEKLILYLGECTRMNIPILPPDVNASGAGFTPSENGILYGMASIKGVGEKAFAAVCKRRPYSSLTDFYKRADAKALNAGVLKALTASGAMDGLYYDRAALYHDCGRLADVALEDRKKGTTDSLWGKTEYLPGGVMTNLDMKVLEQQVLGVVVTRERFVLDVQGPLSMEDWVGLHTLLTGTSHEYMLTYKGRKIAAGAAGLSWVQRSYLEEAYPLKIKELQ